MKGFYYRMESLSVKGEIVNVSDAYARNVILQKTGAGSNRKEFK